MNKLLLLVLILFLVGCSRVDPQYPVSGRVLVEGKPLHKGTVYFVPDAAKGNTHLQFGMGKIGASGTYKAETLKKDGVKAGWYRVMVLATENEPQDSLSWQPIWLVPVKYTKPESSDLVVEVVADPAAGAYDFDLRP